MAGRWRNGCETKQPSQSVYANGDRTTYPAGSVPDGPSGVSDAADGTTFIELTFNEEYRRRIQGLLVGMHARR